MGNPQEYVLLETVREKIKIPHRSSMTRLIKTLEIKGLIRADTRWNGKYNKILSLTPEGEQVGYLVSRDDLFPKVKDEETE